MKLECARCNIKINEGFTLLGDKFVEVICNNGIMYAYFGKYVYCSHGSKFKMPPTETDVISIVRVNDKIIKLYYET